MIEPQKPKPSKADLGARIRTAQDRRSKAEAAKRRADGQRGLAFGLRVGVDLVAGVALGAIVGVLMDRWLETSPLFLLLFFMLGTAAGFLNVFRAVKGYGYAVGYRNDKGDEPPSGGAGPTNADGSSKDDASGGSDVRR